MSNRSTRDSAEDTYFPVDDELAAMREAQISG